MCNKRRDTMREKKFVGWLGLSLFLLAVCLIPLAGVSAAERTEIRVGAINSLTGMNVMTGADQKWAYEQAVADINKKGGVYVKDLDKRLPIKLIFADDKSTAADGAAAMESLIKLKKIDFALSSNITPINIAAGTVCEKYKVFFSIACSWLDQIEEQNFKWCSDFFFSTVSASRSPFDVWEMYPKAERPKKIWLMMEDNPDGQGFAGGFRGHAKNMGYNIALDEPYMPGTKDFSSSILKAQAKNCDAILWLGSPTDSITLIRQIKQNQLNLKYIHGYKGFWPGEFYKALGKDADYIIHDGFWAETLPYPGAEEIGQRYKDDHDGRDSVSIGLYYSNPWVLAQAIEKAGSIDSAKVRDVVFSGNFVAKGTPMGDLKFSEKGLCLTPILALQWMDGKRLPVFPKVYELKWMPSWDQR
jgi:branched-chain amino acid transport system substrate-binding protein